MLRYNFCKKIFLLNFKFKVTYFYVNKFEVVLFIFYLLHEIINFKKGKYSFGFTV